MPRVLEPEVMEGDAEAAAYDELDRKWGDVLFEGFAESALRLGVGRGRVLDVGTGPGRIAIRLARLNPALDIEGVDLSTSMLQLARDNAEKEGVRNVRFSPADAKRLPFESGSFDLVVSHQLLHQLPDPLIALREMNRVARSDGAILVRDVRRLSEPLMRMLLPVWCAGYSTGLRAQTEASFRAGLMFEEFQELVRKSGIERATTRRFFLTHQGVERPALSGAAAPAGNHARGAWLHRAVRTFYLSPSPRSNAHT
jgi:ubiquinone/menaquinone biosynthesis C-methylase UbiE